MYRNNIPFIRKHIREQYEWRVRVMDEECYSMGSCKNCGCIVPQLQMADKACGGNCYPPMLSKKEWKDVDNLMKNQK